MTTLVLMRPCSRVSAVVDFVSTRFKLRLILVQFIRGRRWIGTWDDSHVRNVIRRRCALRMPGLIGVRDAHKLRFLRATAYMLSAHILSQFRPSVRPSVRLSVRLSHG